MPPTVLVLGATGKTGRRLVPRLVDRGATVRSATRRPARHGEVLFDWHRPETHRPALAGADAVFLVGPELVEDHSPLAGPFLELTVDAGLTRVVALSALGVELDVGGPEPGHRKVERQVMATGLEWTVLRPSAIAQNLSEGFQLPGILHQDAVVAPTGEGAVGFVDADDIAAVAAAALTEDGHAKAEYRLTGPEALTYAEVAAAISVAAGRPVAHHDIAPAAMADVLRANGVPDDYAAMLLGHLAAIRRGEGATVTDHVEQVTCRPATSFADFTARAAPAWRR